MGPGEALAILAAGTAAGSVNAVVGSGSLITFPTLLAFGVPPVVANVSNNVGLVPGNVSSMFGYRRELAGQRGRLIRLGVAATVGAAVGAVALLWLPAAALRAPPPADRAAAVRRGGGRDRFGQADLLLSSRVEGRGSGYEPVIMTSRRMAGHAR